MTGRLRYNMFRTRWGYFGILGHDKALVRTSLPLPDPALAKTYLLVGISSAEYDAKLLQTLQSDITAYFKGSCVAFSKAPIDLSGLTGFQQQVLNACRKIPFGQTASYGQLAGSINNPGAVRAVGTALGKNPLPLIVPCHRIINTGGKLGRFSAPGGAETKRRLLDLEGVDL